MRHSKVKLAVRHVVVALHILLVARLAAVLRVLDAPHVIGLDRAGDRHEKTAMKMMKIDVKISKNTISRQNSRAARAGADFFSFFLGGDHDLNDSYLFRKTKRLGAPFRPI